MAVNVEGLLSQLGIGVHRVGREISCSCPFHADRHPSFSINATSGLWVCYSCGRGGTLQMLVQEVGNSDGDFNVVLREIRQAKVPTQKTADEPEELPPPDPLFIYAKYCGFHEPPAWALESRLIGSGSAQHYGIKWDKGWIIPIWDPAPAIDQERLWGWQWKRMSDVRNWPDGVKKSETLFGLRELAGAPVVALVESPLDVVRMASSGVAAVAAYGAYVSKRQQQLLVENADRILLALDNDDAGKKQADKIFPYLVRHVPTHKVIYPEGIKDPGDMDDDQIERTFCDVQGRAVSIPGRRRRHDADQRLVPPRSRPWSW